VLGAHTPTHLLGDQQVPGFAEVILVAASLGLLKGRM
jgi:hypothetical protein